eukprot:gnl/Chilomastix_caulleri/144.p1 GENE.gnl/Chilomastix_caulleri/144~~gnl/Chilomastix_caulleri/144.p1  ORF type:complete len:333 (+),score=155.52 gnl/Chilomastix_caulleri/144:93-1091(+)
MVKVGINGFGRIGRVVARVLQEIGGVELVGVNDLFDTEYLAYLYNHDSVHKAPAVLAKPEGDVLHIGDWKVETFKCRSPADIPWGKVGAQIVVESTGLFTEIAKAEGHIHDSVKKVIISAPSGDAPMFVMGVNESTYCPETMHIISNASCTTNCLAPLTKVINDAFGVESGLMTTIHAVTANQGMVDGPGRDRRLGRSGMLSIIPSTTGAAKAVGKVIPELNGKLTGMSFRVPTADGSVVDLTVNLKKDTTYEEIKKVVKEAAEGEMKGVIRYVDDDIVSQDIIGCHDTSIFDARAGIMLNPRFVKLVAWYDNEIGYSTQLVKLVKYVGARL